MSLFMSFQVTKMTFFMVLYLDNYNRELRLQFEWLSTDGAYQKGLTGLR